MNVAPPTPTSSVSPDPMQLTTWTDSQARIWRVLDARALFKHDILAHCGVQVSSRVMAKMGMTPITYHAKLAYTPAQLRIWSAVNSRSSSAKRDLLAILDEFESMDTIVLSQETAVTQLATQHLPTDEVRTIQWERFVYDDGQVRGISLRAMVEAGLYAKYHHAERAALEIGMEMLPIQVKSPFQNGPPERDLILSLRDAQKFAMRVRTPVGEQIADLILDHHDDFQRLLAGDRATWKKVEAAAARPPEPSVPSTGDPILDQLAILAATRRAQLEQEQRLASIEATLPRLLEAEAARETIRQQNAGLPAPSEDVPALSQRAQINRLVRTYCYEQGMEYADGYRQLYREFRDRHHVDLPKRAKLAGRSPLDVAEEEGLSDKLYTLAHHLFMIAPQGGVK